MNLKKWTDVKKLKEVRKVYPLTSNFVVQNICMDYRSELTNVSLKLPVMWVIIGKKAFHIACLLSTMQVIRDIIRQPGGLYLSWLLLILPTKPFQLSFGLTLQTLLSMWCLKIRQKMRIRIEFATLWVILELLSFSFILAKIRKIYPTSKRVSLDLPLCLPYGLWAFTSVAGTTYLKKSI